MHLKQITLVGFKSFADRVTLNFDQKNITGVVGPNGSGKSNVIDAVRWVMGEQNTKLLRGEKSTDIIFSGSEKRKPLGMAEVTLVFDNRDASVYCPEEYRYEEEIALTRRLYLDGGRELFINRKPCRLKDIVNFFIDSGVGGRSYSMIQQGQVDRILQAKPEQLREIVEEAAGIVVFKKRNEETRRKLAQVQQNLSRLEDIEKEVELRASALEEQALKAKKWQEYTERLKEKEYEYHCQSYLQQQNKRKSLQEGIETEKLKQVQFSTDIATFEAEQAEKQKLLAEKDPEFAIINEEIAKVREKLASSETELVGVIAKDESGEKRLKNIKEEIAEEKKHFAEVNQQNSKLEKDFTDAEDLTKNAEKEWKLFKTVLQIIQNKFLLKRTKLKMAFVI